MDTVRSAQYSEKGGVGKTSVTTGIAAVAGDRGMRVLVADLDPRATASIELGIPITESGEIELFTVNDLLAVNPSDDDPIDPREAIHETIHPAGEGWPATVRVLPAERKLANRETDTSPIELRLKLGLSAVADEFDLILFDLPPRAGGKLVTAALSALEDGDVLIPVELTTDGLDGALHALRTIKQMKMGYNPDINIAGIVRSNVPRSPDIRAIHREIEAQLYERWPELVIGDPLPAAVADVDQAAALVSRYVIRHHSIREECRYAHVPITGAPGREARALVTAYGDLLDLLIERRASRG
ncbi:AAA family ATPase [Streptosporangium sp. NPDC023825]|uniref:ParA family protein n=1 Tax=Streptosporangium sp. NPDC023825 TaxID=3154909 RepID=UPI00341C74AE